MYSSALASLELLERRVGDGSEIRRRVGALHLLAVHLAGRPLLGDDVEARALLTLALEVEPRVRPSTFFA